MSETEPKTNNLELHNADVDQEILAVEREVKYNYSFKLNKKFFFLLQKSYFINWKNDSFLPASAYDFKLKGERIFKGRYWNLLPPFCDLTLKWSNFFPIDRIS